MLGGYCVDVCQVSGDIKNSADFTIVLATNKQYIRPSLGVGDSRVLAMADPLAGGMVSCGVAVGGVGRLGWVAANI